MRSTSRKHRISFRVSDIEKSGTLWLSNSFGETESAACRRVLCSVIRILSEVWPSSGPHEIERRTVADLAALVEKPADLPQWKLLLIAALLTGCEDANP
jgi:hypothetical protein